MEDTWKWTPQSKLCFVTTGATAPFTALIQSVLDPKTIQSLVANGYTHLLVQYGTAKQTFTQHSQAARSHLAQSGHEPDLIIDGLDFHPQGLQSQFQLVQQSKGLIISHAGSGSILEALRYHIPLIVVPNTELLDNHQEELADAMDRANYLIRGDVMNLSLAINKANEFRVKMAQFPPVTSGKHRETKSFAAIMDETMGFMD
ncbi:N-acetylglucosaminyldiphosphodolichol N-acetylglucosaminyltransferase catalytic subunit alg13 [Pleosporales sp. CAS-2024a]